MLCPQLCSALGICSLRHGLCTLSWDCGSVFLPCFLCRKASERRRVAMGWSRGVGGPGCSQQGIVSADRPPGDSCLPCGRMAWPLREARVVVGRYWRRHWATRDRPVVVGQLSRRDELGTIRVRVRPSRLSMVDGVLLATVRTPSRRTRRAPRRCTCAAAPASAAGDVVVTAPGGVLDVCSGRRPAVPAPLRRLESQYAASVPRIDSVDTRGLVTSA